MTSKLNHLINKCKAWLGFNITPHNASYQYVVAVIGFYEHVFPGEGEKLIDELLQDRGKDK